MGVGGQRHALAALPPGMTRYPLYRRLGRPQGRSALVLKISTPGFDPRTIQLVASHYSDYAIPAPVFTHLMNFLTQPKKLIIIVIILYRKIWWKNINLCLRYALLLLYCVSCFHLPFNYSIFCTALANDCLLCVGVFCLFVLL
jgi:hypothetical protein